MEGAAGDPNYLDISVPPGVRKRLKNETACNAFAYVFAGSGSFARLSQTKLTFPVLTIGREKSLGKPLGQQTKLVATNVTVVVLKNTCHWVLEENPKETTDALVKFL